MTDLTLHRIRVELDPYAFAGAANKARTPGIHGTDVLRDLETVMAGGEPKYATAADSGKPNAFSRADLDRFALQGYLWEEALMSAALRRKVRETGGAAVGLSDFRTLPEIAVALDGSRALWLDPELPVELRIALSYGCLIVSPDGLAESPDRLIECKWTIKSANMDPERDRAVWFLQVRLYLLALSAVLGRQVLDVEWHVQFARGTYKGGEPPIYEVWSRRYEQSDVMAIWGMCTAHIAWRVTGDDPLGWRQYVAIAA